MRGSFATGFLRDEVRTFKSSLPSNLEVSIRRSHVFVLVWYHNEFCYKVVWYLKFASQIFGCFKFKICSQQLPGSFVSEFKF